jgi:hypothetical protein
VRYVTTAVVFAGFAVLYMGSLATTNNSKGWIVGWEAEKKTKLAKNEIAYKDSPKSMPGKKESPLFGRIVMYNDILNTLDLHKPLNMEQKKQLFNVLFNYIPAKTQAEAYRIAAIGKYADEKNLQFALAAVKLNEKAPAGSHGFKILTNAWITKTTEKATGAVSKSFNILSFEEPIALVMCWSAIGVVMPDGRLVYAGNLYSKEAEEKLISEAGSNEALKAINLSDFYIKDEKKENDVEAFAMLEKIIPNKNLSPIEATIARLNYFMCLLSAGRTEEAEKIFNEAKQTGKNIKDAGLTHALENEAPLMLALAKGE